MSYSAEAWYQAGSTTKVKGHVLFFTRRGTGPTLICLHGFPTTSWDFAPVWTSLSSRFDTVALDLLGLGRSAKPKHISVSLQADMVEGLAAQLEITEAHILAHDLGDTVAQELLARQLEGTATVRWHSCVLLNGGIFPETHRPRLIQRLLIGPLGPLIAQLSTERTFRRNMTQIFSPAHPPSEEFLRDSWQLLLENKGRTMLPKLIQYMKERVTYRERWVAPLARKLVPLRLINGVLDPVSGAHAADRFAEVVPDADIVRLEHLGHYPHVEDPESFLKSFLEFHDA